MEFTTFDLGSYSVKIINSNGERKAISHSFAQEILLSHLQNTSSETESKAALHVKAIRSFVDLHSPEGKLLIIYPSEYISLRSFYLPTPNLKKAEMMIPFQLEEDVPYETMSSFHFCADL